MNHCRSDQPFISNSGRVKIDPVAWFRGFNPPLDDGYKIAWKVLPMFVNEYRPPGVKDRAQENATTVVQGIPNARHTLELVPEHPANPPSVGAVRADRPPVQAQSPRDGNAAPEKAKTPPIKASTVPCL